MPSGESGISFATVWSFAVRATCHSARSPEQTYATEISSSGLIANNRKSTSASSSEGDWRTDYSVCSLINQKIPRAEDVDAFIHFQDEQVFISGDNAIAVAAQRRGQNVVVIRIAADLTFKF